MKMMRKFAVLCAGCLVFTKIAMVSPIKSQPDFYVYADGIISKEDDTPQHGNVPIDERELDSKKVNIIAERYYAYPGETLACKIVAQSDKWYKSYGIKYIWDERLTPSLSEGTSQCKYQLGNAAAPKSSVFSNLDTHCIAINTVYGISNETSIRAAGTILTVLFTVPENAASGDTFPLKVEVDTLDVVGLYSSPYKIINRWIKIIDNPDADTTMIQTTTAQVTTATTTAKATTAMTKATTATTKAATTTAKAATTTTKAVTATAKAVTTTVKTTTAPVTTTTAAAKPLESGDLTGDGTVGIEDAQITLKAYTEKFAGKDTGLTDAQIKAADVNGDGELTVENAQYILIYYTEKNVAGKKIT